MGDLVDSLAMVEPLDLTSARHVFVSNIGGAGMSAVATLLTQRGHAVSGHDPAQTTPFLPALEGLGIRVYTGAEHPVLPDDVDAVVVSTATPDDAAEVVEGRSRGIPVVHRKAALAALCATRQTVAVAGTHGKTTTAALLATVLTGRGVDAGWVVGAPVPGLGANAAWGSRDAPLVVEADESDGTFLALPAHVAVVTNIEPDHLEYYGDFASLLAAFERFLAGATEFRVVGADDECARRLGQAVGAMSVGEAPESDVRIVDVHPVEPPAGAAEAVATAFRLERNGAAVVAATVPMPGAHNVRNAAMALIAAEALGTPLEKSAEALASFSGVRRRFEHRGTAWGATIIDDYAHLPSEVAAALAAARAGPWRRVVCVFQPHRYSRTEALWRDFADAFADADLLAVTDVYAAGEPPRPGVTGKLIVDAVLDAHPWRHVAYLPDLDDVARWLRVVLRPGDLCLLLGAGDLTSLPDRLIEMGGDSGS
jgi:UDP-N-acetylmuramate--alanine ligase